MNSKVWIGGGAVVLGAAAWFLLTQNTAGGQEVEYRYDTVKKGEVVRSRSANGLLVPLTTVDVKSKAGGIIQRLAVEEGSSVRQGDLVAEIDPRDTQALYEQAEADFRSAQARVDSARTTAALTERDAVTSVEDAALRVKQSEIALARAREQARTQPTLSRAAVDNARAALRAQEEALKQLQTVQIPQRRRDAQSAVDAAKTSMDNAKSNLDRQKNLYDLGYAARNAVEQAENSYESSKSAYSTAQQRLTTLEADFQADIRSSQARVEQSKASLRQAEAGSSQVTIAEQDLKSAQQALELAKVNLQQAKDARLNVKLRQTDVTSASAGAVRSRVSMRNAKEQLDSTQVKAPRTGVVTLKYLEEGTIIPPGTSTFAQGTSIVQIADTTRMFVECAVDEADIAAVHVDQTVRIVVEAYPGQTFTGIVRKVFPAAESANNVTSVKVRVEFTGLSDIDRDKFSLRPGMNATCEFIEYSITDTLVVPEPAIIREGDKTFVQIRSSDPMKPEKKEVTLGKSGDDGVQVISGLNEGDEIVVAKIDLAALRDRAKRMEEQAQGGGLGSQRQGGPSQSRASSGGGGGGGR